MSTSDPHGTDKSAEEPIPQTSLDVLLWKLDLLEAIINELPNPVFAKNSDTRFCFSLYKILRQQEESGLFGPFSGKTVTILRPEEFFHLAES